MGKKKKEGSGVNGRHIPGFDDEPQVDRRPQVRRQPDVQDHPAGEKAGQLLVQGGCQHVGHSTAAATLRAQTIDYTRIYKWLDGVVGSHRSAPPEGQEGDGARSGATFAEVVKGRR